MIFLFPTLELVDMRPSSNKTRIRDCISHGEDVFVRMHVTSRRGGGSLLPFMSFGIFPSPHLPRIVLDLSSSSQPSDSVSTNERLSSMDVKNTLKNDHGVDYDPEKAVIPCRAGAEAHARI